MDQSLERQITSGDIVIPPARRRLDGTMLVKPLLAVGLAVTLVACGGGGGEDDDRTVSAAGAGTTETTADDLESTTTTTQEVVEDVDIHSAKEVVPTFFTQESMLQLVGAQPGDYIQGYDVRDTDPYSGETAQEGRLSTYDMLIWNDDPNLPVQGVGRVSVNVYDLAIMEELITEQEGGPAPDGMGPWGSIENEATVAGGELFTYVDGAGREYQAAYVQGRLRVDAGGYSLSIIMHRQDPANPDQNVMGALYENGAVTPYFEDAVDNFVRGVFHGELGEPVQVEEPVEAAPPSTTTTTQPPEVEHDLNAPPESMPDNLSTGDIWVDQDGFQWLVQEDGSAINIGQGA